MPRLHPLFLIAATSAFAIPLDTRAAVRAYPKPAPEVEASPFYDVTVIQGGQRHSLFVGISHARTEGAGTQYVTGRTLSYAGFAATGVVELEVRLLDDPRVSPGSAIVRPTRFHIDAEMTDDRTVRFTPASAGQFTVEFGKDGHLQGLVVAFDPWETRPADPDSSTTLTIATGSLGPPPAEATEGKDTLFFEPGVHDLKGNYHLPEQIREVYLAPGALVHGAFFSAFDDVTFHGRGILSGARMAWREGNLIETPPNASRVFIDGLFVVDYPKYAIRTLSRDTDIRWVKCVGAWVYNADGLVAWARTSIANCFIHADDDAIKVYDSDISVSDCVIWQMTNGACLQLGWSSLEGHRVRVRDIDIVRAEWRNAEGANNSVINLRLPEGSGNTQSDFIIENIRVETPVGRVIDLRFHGKKDGDHGGPHHLTNFVFRNIDARMLPADTTGSGNYFLPYDADHGYENFRFINLRINGTLITENNWSTAGRFLIPPEVKPEVTFSAEP